MKKMLRLGLVPLTALTLAAVVNAPVVRAEETISTGVASTLPEPQTPPENQQQPKTITVELVSKAEDGTVLDTLSVPWELDNDPQFGNYRYTYVAYHFAGYRLSHYTRQEVTYDEVQDGDKVVLEAIYKPVDLNSPEVDGLTFAIQPIDSDRQPLPLAPKTVSIYPGEVFYPKVTNTPVYPGYTYKAPDGLTSYDIVKNAIDKDGSYTLPVIYSPVETKEEMPENQYPDKTITVERVAKTEDGTVLETSTNNFIFSSGDFSSSFTYTANHIAGYRLSHYTRQVVTYDEVENGDKVVLEAIYKPVVSDKLDEDALTFSVKPIDTNLNPLPLEFKTATIYPGEFFFASIKNAPVYPGYEFRGHLFIPTYDIIKEAITERGSYILPVIYSPVETKEETPDTGNGQDGGSLDTTTPPAPQPKPEDSAPKEELKNKTITIIEERQDEDGRVIFKKEHVFNLKPHQEEQLPLDQTLDQLIRGSNIASWDAYDDGAVIHFTTRRRPKADKPDTTLDDLKKDQQTPEVKPNSVPTPKPEDKPTPTPVPKDLSADRNKLLLSLDESKLTDEQKGKLAEKIAFAETEKDLADLKAELVKLVKAAEKPTEKAADKPMTGKTEVKAPTPAATAKPAANTPAKSDKVALPATGDGARLGLLAAGFSLLLLGLGLAKARKHN